MGIVSSIGFFVECDSRKAKDDCWQHYMPELDASPEVVIKQALAEGWRSRDGLWFCPKCVKVKEEGDGRDNEGT